MTDQIKRHIDALLKDEDLPSTTMERATLFIRIGDLHCLTQLPLEPDAMMEVGSVLAQASSNRYSTASGDTAPVLSDAVRKQLHTLVDENSEHVEAALFVLSRDLRIRAQHRARSESK